MTYLLFNVYWFLLVLNPGNIQSSDVIAYLLVDYTTSRMSLCTGIDEYNQVKKLAAGECASVLCQKKYAAHRMVGMLQIVFWLSGEYTQDLRFVLRTRNMFWVTFWNISFQETRTLRLSIRPCIDAQ